MEGLARIPFVALCAGSRLDYKLWFFFLFVAKVREMMQQTSSVFQCDLCIRLWQQDNAFI